MDVVTILDELQNQALRDPEVRNRFLDTRQAKEPLTAFCGVRSEEHTSELQSPS